MTMLTLTAIDSRVFSCSRQHKTLIAEHSDLGRVDIHQRLYDDAADVGIAIRNSRTGNVTYWYMAEEKRDRDGDLEVTVYYPCADNTGRNRQLTQGWAIHILND